MIKETNPAKSVLKVTPDEILLPAGAYDAWDVVKCYLQKFGYREEVTDAYVKSFVNNGFPICSKLLGHPVVDKATNTIVGRDILPTLVVLALYQDLFQNDGKILQALYEYEVIGTKSPVRYNAFREAFVKFLGKLEFSIDDAFGVKVETFEDHFNVVIAIVKGGDSNELADELDALRLLGGWGNCDNIFNSICHSIARALHQLGISILTVEDAINRYGDYSGYDEHGQVAKVPVVFENASQYILHLYQIAINACFSEDYVPVGVPVCGKHSCFMPFSFMVECLDFDLATSI